MIKRGGVISYQVHDEGTGDVSSRLRMDEGEGSIKIIMSISEPS